MRHLIAIFLLCLYSVYGQNTTEPNNQFEVMIVNDALFQTDQDYTGSIGLAYRFGSIPLTVKYQIDTYTPSKNDCDLSEPQPDTHPYAGYGYLGLQYEYFIDDWRFMLSTKLGSTGKYSFAQDVQDAIHKMIGDVLFQGWDSQVQTRLGYIFNPRIEYLVDFAPLNFAPFLDVELGNIKIQQAVGIEMLSNINGLLIQGGGANIFLSYAISNVSRNVFLTGFDNYEYGVKIVSPVHQFQAGLEFRYDRIGFKLITHFKSKEYIGQRSISRYSTIIFSLSI